GGRGLSAQRRPHRPNHLLAGPAGIAPATAPPLPPLPSAVFSPSSSNTPCVSPAKPAHPGSPGKRTQCRGLSHMATGVERKSNPVLVDLIGQLRNAGRTNEAPLWRDIADRLERPSRNW